jgi:hypothetical protein
MRQHTCIDAAAVVYITCCRAPCARHPDVTLLRGTVPSPPEMSSFLSQMNTKPRGTSCCQGSTASRALTAAATGSKASWSVPPVGAGVLPRPRLLPGAAPAAADRAGARCFCCCCCWWWWWWWWCWRWLWLSCPSSCGGAGTGCSSQPLLTRTARYCCCGSVVKGKAATSRAVNTAAPAAAAVGAGPVQPLTEW